jgi:aerobic C4-dicarboxylate transport protein
LALSGFISYHQPFAVVSSIPITGLLLIVGINCFMVRGATTHPLHRQRVAVIVVARWEKELDSVQLTQELTGARSRSAQPPGEGSRQFADL